MKFTKSPTTVNQQIQLLENRGMNVPDHAKARHYLSHFNYYRIGAYWLPFEVDHASHQFKEGTSFEDVLDLYIFDRELRLLVMDAIERFEVSVRTRLAHHLAHTYGPHAFLKQEIFKEPGLFQRHLERLEKELKRSQEIFVTHYRHKYTNPLLPPIWAAVEVMSLGQLSKWYYNLKKRSDRQSIADGYNINEVIITSFLHHLTIIRNICAHHNRLWNRKFSLKMKIPRRGPKNIQGCFNTGQPEKLYNTLAMLEYLIEIISPDTHWKWRLFALFEKHPAAKPEAMGFPDGWEKLALWN